jgi:hypothetical protein
MVEHELDLKRLLVDGGGRKVLRALSERGPGDSESVDRVRLAGG